MFMIKNSTLHTSKLLFNYGKCNIRMKSVLAPRRALLYVPGDSIKKLKKACSLNVDNVTMDCEDGVAQNKKDAARTTIHSLLNEGKPKSQYSYDLAVRVNPISSHLCADDLSALLTANTLPDTLVIPKVDDATQLKWLSDAVAKHIKKEQINLILTIESASAMIQLPQICKTAKELPNLVVNSLIFGSDDFCANIGVTRTENSIEILYARQKLVMVAKAFHLQAIDMVYINYKDLEGLKKQCEEGMRMGYTGKQVIHPNQVPVAHETFLPTPKQIEWATGLIAAFNAHQKKGVGAFEYKGSMIDMPTLRQAENIIKLVNSTK